MNTAVTSTVRIASQIGSKKPGVRNIAKDPIDLVVSIDMYINLLPFLMPFICA